MKEFWGNGINHSPLFSNPNYTFLNFTDTLKYFHRLDSKNGRSKKVALAFSFRQLSKIDKNSFF
jgi:hypothetical protein